MVQNSHPTLQALGCTLPNLWKNYSTMEKLHKIKAIAKQAELSPSTIRRLIKKHSLPHYKIGGNQEIAMTREQIELLVFSNARLITQP